MLLLICEGAFAQVGTMDRDSAATFDIGEACEAVTDVERSTELFEHLSWLLDHPLDLNRVGEDDLLRIPGVSSRDVSLLLRSRSRAGGYTGVEQLMRHGADGVRLYHALAPFVHTDRREGTYTHFRSRAGWRSSRDVPDTTTGVPGFREYHRIDVAAGNVVDGGFMMVRDAGERYADAFYSGCAALSFDRGIVERVIAGDFAVGCAHGLVFGQGTGMAGRMPGSGLRAGGLKMEPFHGSSGTRLLRGLGVARSFRFRTGVLALAGFAARTPFSASLDEDGKVRSFDIAYDHSDPPASGRRSTINEWGAGGRAAWSSATGVSCGVSLFWRRLSRPFSDGSVYAPVAVVRVIGIDASFVHGSAEFSVEGAWMKQGHGFSASMGITTEHDLRIMIRGWHCGPGFHPGKSGTGPLGGETNNETGAFLGWETAVWKKITCSGSIALFRRPWRTSFDRMPPAGSETMISIEVPISRTLNVSGRLSTRAGESWEQEPSSLRLPDASMERSVRRTVRGTIGYRITREIRLQTRVEHVIAGALGPARQEHGWLISQDLHAALSRDLSMDLRCSSVQTDSYASRIYILERDVKGAFAGVPLYGTGVRWYLFLRYVITPGMVLSGKFASAARTSGAFISAVDQTVTVQLDVANGTGDRVR